MAAMQKAGLARSVSSIALVQAAEGELQKALPLTIEACYNMFEAIAREGSDLRQDCLPSTAATSFAPNPREAAHD